MFKPYLIILILFIISCQNINKKDSFKIDSKTYNSISKSHRIRHIIIHYTYADDELSKKLLTGNGVSSHYLITTKKEEPIYSLVDENYRAWHAGESAFDGRLSINDTSIGIEIVHTGYIVENATNAKKTIKQNEEEFIKYEDYLEYDETQIKKLVFLLKNIVDKYDINPKNIVGHSDISPLRKQDPGPKFPWKKLHDEYGLGIWYDENDYSNFMNDKEYKKSSVSNIKYEFIKYGYNSMPTNNVWDLESRKVLYAFQCHFRPQKIDANIDEETYAIIRALNEKVAKLEKEHGDYSSIKSKK